MYSTCIHISTIYSRLVLTIPYLPTHRDMHLARHVINGPYKRKDTSHDDDLNHRASPGDTRVSSKVQHIRPQL